MKYTPPTCFLGFQKMWGGPPDATFLAQRWYGTPFHNVHTYIHTFILSYIHIYIYIYYIHIITHRKMQRWNFWGGVVAKPWYFTVLAGSPLKKSIANARGAPLCFLPRNTRVKFLRGGSCKTMVFYSSSRVPPKKITFLVLTRVGPTRKPHN